MFAGTNCAVFHEAKVNETRELSCAHLRTGTNPKPNKRCHLPFSAFTLVFFDHMKCAAALLGAEAVQALDI